MNNYNVIAYALIAAVIVYLLREAIRDLTTPRRPALPQFAQRQLSHAINEYVNNITHYNYSRRNARANARAYFHRNGTMTIEQQRTALFIVIEEAERIIKARIDAKNDEHATCFLK